MKSDPVRVLGELAGMPGADRLQAVVEDPSLLDYLPDLLAELRRLRERCEAQEGEIRTHEERHLEIVGIGREELARLRELEAVAVGWYRAHTDDRVHFDDIFAADRMLEEAACRAARKP